MSYLKLVLVCFFLILPFPFSSEGAGKIEKKSYFFKEAEKDISYSLYVPSSYSEKKKIPLIVLLQGLGSNPCLLYTSPSPRDKRQSRMPSSA